MICECCLVVDAHDALSHLQVFLLVAFLLLELVVVGDSACLEAGPRPAVPASAAAPHGGAAGERRGRTTAGPQSAIPEQKSDKSRAKLNPLAKFCSLCAFGE